MRACVLLNHHFSLVNAQTVLSHSRVFRPELYSGRSANFVLNDSRKKLVATVGIEARPLAQVSETILTELTWQVLIEGSLNSLLLVHQLTFGLE